RVREVQQELQAAFGERLVYTIYAYRYFPGWHFFTVHDVRATKDQGIRALQEGWGLQGLPLVVFGDDVNDMAMFRIASRAVAVRNAIPDVKALAHEVIGSNEEDSVLRWISRHHAGAQA
ncbi:MAG TPA: HAD hydrolase family protein, partial [bacterium]|nr:HAD hydrolase family protein [bacterium]